MATAIVTMADLQKQLAARLQDQRNALPPPTSVKIKLKKDGFYMPDGAVLDSLEGVVVDMRYLNALYTKRYVPGQIESPDCWAIGSDFANMVPSDTSAKVQHSSCDGCPSNEWESAGGGSRGKACSNKIRLAVIPPDATDKSVPLILELAPTSTKAFLAVLRGLTIPLQVVVLKFTLDPKVDYPKVITTLDGPAPDAIAPFLMGLLDKAQASLDRGFDFD